MILHVEKRTDDWSAVPVCARLREPMMRNRQQMYRAKLLGLEASSNCYCIDLGEPAGQE